MYGLIGKRERKTRHIRPDGSRYYTPASANRALVLLRRVVGEIVEAYPEMIAAQETYESGVRGGQAAQAEPARRRLVAAASSIRRSLDVLEEMGVELRDWALGIVDFPAWAGGREVRLCWQLGEPAVRFWHEAGEGFISRRPLCELPQAVPDEEPV